MGTPGSAQRVRGGSWNNHSNNTRSANRNRNNPSKDYNNIGFRCALPYALVRSEYHRFINLWYVPCVRVPDFPALVGQREP
ncbi:MAG: SUMF1/EgtB/PvdO family nonheme iron enzyme [Anaerolineaceae bacterium]|nr:SUMF1/EgtB/PvdO family nonheme iron enzyme [Anaerolineaceae bacterium]